jgi:ADP-ribose pyrophosphatase
MSDYVKLGEPTVLYGGRFIELVSRPVSVQGGPPFPWEYIRRRGVTRVVFVVAVTADDELVLVRQFRVPLASEVWELPAGLVDHADEDSCECAGRELIEETGYRAERLAYLTRGPVSSGASATVGEYILATGLTHVGAEGGDELFPMVVERVPLDRVVGFIAEREAAGEMADPRILAGVKLAEVHRGR